MRLTACRSLLTNRPYITAALAVSIAAAVLHRSLSTTSSLATTTTTTMSRPATQEQWRQALDELPKSSKIPAISLAHGQPMLIWPASAPKPRVGADIQAPNGPLVRFLKDLGPALLANYDPKAIVVFSAHWETHGQALVTDYGDDEGSNPLLMDYFGFPEDLYKVQFSSRGNSALSRRIVDLLTKAGIRARLSPKSEARGEDGRGFEGPGLDHGVFVPFIHMFGTNFNTVPIVQVSINSTLALDAEWALGAALDELRADGVLIISGGLPVHTFREPTAFAERSAAPVFKDWCEAILAAAEIQDPAARKEALYKLPNHPGFRRSNPREEHFVPLYIAAGAGKEGGSKVLASLYGAPTIAFGL